jgi:nickel-dependent lactate racemase
MLVRMNYGKRGLEVDVPDGNLAGILRMRKIKPLENPSEAVRRALDEPIACEPLGRLAQGVGTGVAPAHVCIVVSDITRPVPNKIILPPILDVLEKHGIHREDIVILVATGIHRPNEGEELDEMLGADVARNYRIVNHISRKPEAHKYLGTSSRGIPVYVNKTYLNADLRILTGLIEPHLMAGYSGGRKAICPGLCSVETMKIMHGPHILEDERAAAGIMDSNPFHEGALEIARMAGADFILNVDMNEEREITGVFAGDLAKAHEEGVKHVEQMVKAEVDEPADIVLVSSAGYPLDTTFYQAIKGMVAAMDVVKRDGSIILVSECSDGIGGPEFTDLVLNTKDISSFVEKLYDPDFFVVDQWMLEEMAKVVKKAKIYCYCDGVEDNVLRQLSVESVSSPEQAIELALARQGSGAKLLAIPEGPYVLAMSNG